MNMNIRLIYIYIVLTLARLLQDWNSHVNLSLFCIIRTSTILSCKTFCIGSPTFSCSLEKPWRNERNSRFVIRTLLRWCPLYSTGWPCEYRIFNLIFSFFLMWERTDDCVNVDVKVDLTFVSFTVFLEPTLWKAGCRTSSTVWERDPSYFTYRNSIIPRLIVFEIFLILFLTAGLRIRVFIQFWVSPFYSLHPISKFQFYSAGF